MPFLARLTSDHHHAPEGPADANTGKKRAHEPRQFEEAREKRKEAKRPRLSTHILSSRPKLFANGLLSPVKSVATSPTVPDRPLGQEPGPAKKVGTTTRSAFDARKNGKNALRSSTGSSVNDDSTRSARSGPLDAYFSKNKSKDKIEPTCESSPAPQEQQQQQQTPRPDDKRSLRSHDGGTRARSELAQYFPNWDEIISDDPLPQDPITHRTKVHIIDEPPKPPSTPSRARQVILPLPPTPATPSTPIVSLSSPSGSRGLFSAATGVPVAIQPSAANIAGPPAQQTFVRIDFSAELAKLARNAPEDALSESHFRPAHQRGERQEKQLRNIEKEKAQHEKVQLERLYEGLLGRDWLRQMGISGVTDGEKREKWETKRDYVISEVKAMLDKFERYRDEEKRLRMEKEAHMREEDEESESDKDDGDGEEAESQDNVGSDREIPDTEAEDSERNVHETEHRKRRRRPLSTGRGERKKKPRRLSLAEEKAAAAANQLLTETFSLPTPQQQPTASVADVQAGPAPTRPTHRRFTSISSRTGIDVTPQVKYPPAGSERPFISFFDKAHVRSAAIEGHRRGRVRFAFGHPVPEPEEKEFELPEDWLTKEARRDAARLRRMRRRGQKMDT